MNEPEASYIMRLRPLLRNGGFGHNTGLREIGKLPSKALESEITVTEMSTTVSWVAPMHIDNRIM